MIGLIITGHGHFASGMQSALALIQGEAKNLATVDFEQDHSTETLTENLEAAIQQMEDCQGILVLADLVGGSPFKMAVECKYRSDLPMEVLGGANFPMVIQAALTASFTEALLPFADEVAQAGRDFIRRFELEAHEDDVEEGGI